MAGAEYSRVPLHENKSNDNDAEISKRDARHNTKSMLWNVAIAVVCFALGFGLGDSRTTVELRKSVVPNKNGRLPPQSFIPDIPIKEVQFSFPTDYEDTGELGDGLWNDMMPIGAGFLRVPYPRKYDMPSSKIIPGDHQLAEAVLRHVIMKYEVRDKSPFAGAGHEYHCLDYLRQAILCAGDTTLDHADLVYDEDGSDRKSGFTGANATHQCRDWDAIKAFLMENREGNKTGILF